MEKKCFKCGKTKDTSSFYKHSEMSDGFLGKCKDCTKKDSEKNRKKIKGTSADYDRTEKGVIRVLYKTQKRASKVRGHEPPKYTKEEFSNWLYLNGFKKLYLNWVKSGFKKDMKPSCDRTDTFKGYSFDNIVLNTWLYNRNNQYIDILTGSGTSGRCCKPVAQYNSQMKFIRRYVSYSECKRLNGYSMEDSLRRGIDKPDRKGFIYKYI